MIIGDCGTVWTKIYYQKENRFEIVPSNKFLSDNDIILDISTGHSGKIKTRKYENELIALAKGGLSKIDEDNFIILDAGGRDTKYINFKNRRVSKLDWNVSCGSSTGITYEMMCKYYQIDIEKLPYTDNWIDVTCGIFALEKVMELVSKGAKPTEAISKFIHGLARTLHSFVQKPDKIYLSGGFSENKAFLKSLKNYSDVVPLGRFVLVEGLKSIIYKDKGK